MFIPIELEPKSPQELPEWRKEQIRSLWRTRADSFSRAQLREILRIEQSKRAEAYEI